MPKNMHPEDIKAAVRKTGVSLAELARRNGLAAVSGRRALYVPLPSMQRAIAAHLNRPVNQIWPEWYRQNGSRILNFERKTSTESAASHRQKRSAA